MEGIPYRVSPEMKRGSDIRADMNKYKREAKMDAVDRGWQLMEVPVKDLPDLANQFRNHLARQVGICMEVCLTAYAVYAQCVEGLECKDDLYIARLEDRQWFRDRGYDIPKDQVSEVNDKRGNEMNYERSTHQLAVDEFMTRAGQNLPDKPTIPDAATRILRAKLIMEEAMETIEAMGVEIESDGALFCSKYLKYFTTNKVDIVGVVDGCCDIAVVTTGTLSAFGISNINPQRLVDESNLAKFGEGGYCREDGKWIKPPNWQAPNWIAELKRQGWEG